MDSWLGGFKVHVFETETEECREKRKEREAYERWENDGEAEDGRQGAGMVFTSD